jgi:hypothetical protein
MPAIHEIFIFDSKLIAAVGQFRRLGYPVAAGPYRAPKLISASSFPLIMTLSSRNLCST